MNDEMSWTEEPGDLPADRLHRRIAHGQEDERGLAHAVQFRLPTLLLGPVPPQDHADACRAQRRGQDLTYGAAA